MQGKRAYESRTQSLFEKNGGELAPLHRPTGGEGQRIAQAFCLETFKPNSYWLFKEMKLPNSHDLDPLILNTYISKERLPAPRNRVPKQM